MDCKEITFNYNTLLCFFFLKKKQILNTTTITIKINTKIILL